MHIGILLSLTAPRPGTGVAVGTPANTAPPVISGGPAVGATLTASAGTWTGDPTPTVSRQWRRNGADIPGATGSTLSTTGYSAGDVIFLRETATNTNGSASADSAGLTLTAEAPADALTDDAGNALADDSSNRLVYG